MTIAHRRYEWQMDFIRRKHVCHGEIQAIRI